MKKLLLAIAAIFLPIDIPSAWALDHGYWVVVGNLPLGRYTDPAQEAIEARAARCGFKTFNDASEKFGFQSGFESFVLGAYSTRAEAKAVQTAVASVFRMPT